MPDRKHNETTADLIESNPELVSKWKRDVEKWVACEQGPPPENYDDWPEFKGGDWLNGRLQTVWWPDSQDATPVDPAWTQYFCVDCDETGEEPTPTPATPFPCPLLADASGDNVNEVVFTYLEDYPGYCPGKSLAAKRDWKQSIVNWIACRWSNYNTEIQPPEGDNINSYLWPAEKDRPEFVRWPKDISAAKLREQTGFINANWEAWGFGIENPDTRATEPNLTQRKDLPTMDYWNKTKEYHQVSQSWAPCGEYAEVFHNDQHWRANAENVPAGKEPGNQEPMPTNLIERHPCDTAGSPTNYHTWWWKSFTNIQTEQNCDLT
jgi:hypothetical protein